MSLDAKVIRRHLNSRLQPIGEAGLSRPARGWIRAIRDALGMTANHLGKRMGVSQPTITQMEHNEVAGAITLATLERAAHALGCTLTYAFVPDESLETRVTTRAEDVARRRLQRVGHTMKLEGQGVDSEARERQVREIAQRLLRDQPRRIWDEP